jgi:hypothetical protein
MSTGEPENNDEPTGHQIELNLPFDSTFEECMLALQQFTFREIEEFNPVKGTIEARVSSPSSQKPGILGLPGRESRIIMVLRKLSSGRTKVTVTSQEIIPPDFDSLFPKPPINPLHDMEKLMVITSFLRSRESQPVLRPGLEEIWGQPGVPKERWVLVDPSETAFMSLILPGMGQNYAGRYGRGLMFAVLVAAGLIFYIVPGILLWIAAGYDAYRIARQVNCGSLPFVPVNFGMLMVQVIMGGGIIFCVLHFGFAGYFPFHG